MANKKTGDIEIGGRLFNTATGNIVAGADAIKDEAQDKTQAEINVETYEHVADIDAALQELSPDQTEALALATDVNTLKAKSVRSDEVQSLTAEEKARALGNLGISGIDDVPTAGSDNLVKSGGIQNELALGTVYDVSAKNPTAGPNNDGKFESLFALLSDANLNTLIPVSVRKGGMSIKFVCSSDHKYVLCFLPKNEWSIDSNDWEKMNLEEEVSQLDQKVDLGDNTHIGTFVAAFEEENYAVTVTDPSVKPTSVIPGQRIRVYVKSQALSRFSVYAYPANSSKKLIKEIPSGTDFSNGIEFDFVCPLEMEKDSVGVTKIVFSTWAEVTLEEFDCWRLEPNNSSSFDALKKSSDKNTILLGGTVDLQPTKVDGTFISNAGIETSNADFSHTDPFFVPSGTELKVTATGYSNHIAIIALYNENGGTYTPLVISIDTTQREYTYTTKGDCYLVISYDHREPITINGTSPNIYGRFNGVDQLVGTPSVIKPTIISGKVINNAGVESDNANFSHTIPFAVTTGTKIKVSAAGYLATVSIISCYDKDLDEFIPLVVSNGSNVQDYEYTASVAMFIVICFRTSTGYTHLFSIEPTPILDSMPELSKQKGDINILSEFDNIVCAGDSLTYSQVMTQETTANSRQAKRPYPEVLSKLCGNDYAILASPGYNATQWWGNFADQIVAKENPIAIIYLGTNNGLSDTLDTDVVGDDPDNWAENYTGDYCRIVNKFKTLGYRILLLKIWYTNAGGARDLIHTNSAIEHIGERFGCAVMDVPRTKDLQYHYWPNLQGYNTIHYNDLGYAWFASKLVEDSGMLPTEQMKFLIPE